MFVNNDGLCINRNTGKFISRLKEIGADVENFHFKEKIPKNYYMATFNVLDISIRITAIRKNKNKLLAYIKAYYIGVRRLVYNDFTYIFYPNSFLYLTFISILLKKPYGIYIRGEMGVYKKIPGYIFKKASIVYTVSPVFTNIVLKLGGNSETIRPMIDYSSFDIIRNRKYEKKELYKLLFLARVEYPKGIEDLIKAIDVLVNQGIKNILLEIVGYGPEYDSIQKMIWELNLDSYVKLVGLVTDDELIRQYYVNSDIYICPTHDEGFPRVLYEAMIFGTPIITTMVGTIGHLMKDSYNCLSIEPKDPTGIANKIRLAIEDYPNIGELANNAILTIDNYLSLNNITHSEQLYNHVQKVL